MTAEILNQDDFSKIGGIFNHPSFDNHEQVVYCYDQETGLKAIIGIHNTTLGPSLGGTRMWAYNNELEALNDVLRLSRGMTFKSAISGLDLGGGKAVIIGDAKTQKTPKLLLKFAEFVDSLSGRYITAEDVGMATEDMDLIHTVTKHVVGLSESLGGSGNPSPVTAHGVYMGMKGAAKYAYGNDSLAGKTIYVQGIGNVGEVLVEKLAKEEAKVFITDLNRERLEMVRDQYGVSIYEGNNLYGETMDIYAPCALGATINDETLPQLTAKIIAGSANNQLANEPKHGKMLKEKGIIYAPDFLVNAGGVINVYAEVKNLTKEAAQQKTENIYHTTLEILKKADESGITTYEAAHDIAQARIDARKRENQK